jgi:oxygen-independent coproporphyrinogen-3 oxidase
VENYELARSCGFDNINVDLMSALPKQTLTSYEETLNNVIALQPEHISSYSLIIEEGTKFWTLYGDEGSRLQDLPSVELDRRMYEKSKQILEAAGYYRYEISNYAKASYECRHNIGYWRRIEYLGFGLGASSLYHNQRFSNTSELDDYVDMVSENRSCWCDIQNLSLKEAMEEFMFLGLRLSEGVGKQQFFEQFKKNIDDIYGEVLEKLCQKNLIVVEHDVIKLTDYGVDISNTVLAEFLL